MTADQLAKISALAAPMLQAVSISVTAIFAIVGLNAWRRQLVGKRRIEIAEQTLLAAYKMRDAFTYFRSVGAFTGEGRSRPDRDDEPEAIRSQGDAYFVPIERIKATSDAFAEFSKAALMCEVYFGTATAKPFHDVLRMRNRVVISARMLLTMTQQKRNDAKNRDRWEADIWEGSHPEIRDEIAETVSVAIQTIEAMCRPLLAGKRSNWWFRPRRSPIDAPKGVG